MSKYPKLFGAGGLCASITHYVTVPLDVVKTRLRTLHAVLCRICSQHQGERGRCVYVYTDHTHTA